jgi:hypothetical protein
MPMKTCTPAPWLLPKGRAWAAVAELASLERGVNHILGAGLHSCGFGSGAAAESMMVLGLWGLAISSGDAE